MEVTVVDYKSRKNAEGETFYALVLEGDITMVQSRETGSFYATKKQASMTSTFDEDTAASLIGKTLPGKIERVDCQPYEFTIEDSGEVITLSHRYQFIPEGHEVPKPSTLLAAEVIH